jgi:DNA-binding CsgD family transcriptional regulator/DNA-binding transcriptional regulator GbsR (MarR family)
MTQPSALGTIDVNDRKAMGIVGSPIHGGVFELIRRFRGGAAAADIVAASGLSESTVYASIDALQSLQLIRRVRSRKDRRIRYAAQCRRILIAVDPERSDEVRTLHDHFRVATEDIAQALLDAAKVTNALSEHQHRINARLKLELRPSEWPEFLRLTRSLVDFLENVAQSRVAGKGSSGQPSDQRCDHVLSIQLSPCVTPLLPGPAISVVGRDPRRPRQASPHADQLTPREREVATLAAVGVRRNEIARRLGITTNTVATLLRRTYLKLHVSNREGLAVRLGRAGADKPAGRAK